MSTFKNMRESLFYSSLRPVSKIRHKMCLLRVKKNISSTVLEIHCILLSKGLMFRWSTEFFSVLCRKIHVLRPSQHRSRGAVASCILVGGLKKDEHPEICWPPLIKTEIPPSEAKTAHTPLADAAFVSDWVKLRHPRSSRNTFHSPLSTIQKTHQQTRKKKRKNKNVHVASLFFNTTSTFLHFMFPSPAAPFPSPQIVDLVLGSDSLFCALRILKCIRWKSLSSMYHKRFLGDCFICTNRWIKACV